MSTSGRCSTPRRGRRWLRLAAAVSASCTPGIAAQDDLPFARPDVDPHLASMILILSDGPQPVFVLRYRGPRIEFRGPLCYAFAGYNETCMEPKIGWLTPATEIELSAPGGVPRELLRGYVLIARFPWMSDNRFSYAVTEDDD